ncbi:hypothetical protein [Sphingobacterium spiritivorum]
MKTIFISPLIAMCVLASCNNTPEEKINTLSGSWKLIESKTIKEKDTTIAFTDTSKTEMIKMFNDTDFAFFNHDKSKGKDSTAFFVSGSGKYILKGDQYRENLQYCSLRDWEGKSFDFTLTMKGDTLIQKGIEHIPELNVDHEIVESYIRIR